MLDPYMVLGVGKYDDDQTVKKAYRQLSKQYHPDNNLNNPNKDAAEETFKKIQQAYEQIMHERSIGIGGPDDLKRQQSTRPGSAYSNGYYGSGDSSYNSNTNNRRDNTATKDRYTDGFWKNTGFGNTNNSGSSSYNSNNNSYNNSSNSNYNSNSYNRNTYNSNNNSNSYNNSSNGYNNGNNSYNNNSYSNNYSDNSNNGYYNSGNSDNYNSGNNSYYNNNNSNTGYYSGNNNYTRNNADGYAGYGYYSSQNAHYDEDAEGMLGTVANKLNNRKFYDAWDILNSMNTRNDVWYYYSAIANLGLGNSITALNHARTAKAMQPSRPEYDELINGIQSGAIHYQGRSDMFVPQKGNSGNTCVKVGLAMLFFNVFCGGGGAICGSIGFCC